MSLKHHVPFVVALSSFAVVVACGSSVDDNAGASSGDVVGSSGSSGSSGFGASGGTSGGASSSGDPGCAAQEAAATAATRPVDIIFVIDNSGSMSGEIEEVENQINDNFAKIIEASKIDYRVIMVSAHGASGSERVCIKAPLSGTTCSPIPAQPVETARFFHHSTTIGSHDSLCQLLRRFNEQDQYLVHPNGYKDMLRKEAFKTFVVITDDGVSCTANVNGGNKTFNDSDNLTNGPIAADAWDAELLALSPEHFGTAQKRNYVFHSIIGIADFNASDKTLPHPPTAPLTTGKCPNGSVAPGSGYQALSVKTGGLRYPTCDLNYTTIFKAMAQGVVEGARLSCEFGMPAPPPGETIDPSSAVARYTSGTGQTKDFGQVPNAAACAPDKFYIEGDRIKLCPAACDLVQADVKANMKILFACQPKQTN